MTLPSEKQRILDEFVRMFPFGLEIPENGKDEMPRLLAFLSSSLDRLLEAVEKEEKTLGRCSCLASP